MVATLREVGRSEDGWTVTFVDPATGEQWRRIYLGAEYHGGGLPVLVKQPMPDVAALLELVARASDPAEMAAGAWLLTELDREGDHKEALLEVAEGAAQQGITHAQNAWLVGVNSRAVSISGRRWERPSPR